MGAGASSRRATATSIYKAYEDDVDMCRQQITEDESKEDATSNSVLDESSSKGDNDSVLSRSREPRRRRKRVRFANVVTLNDGRSARVETAELASPEDSSSPSVNEIMEADVLRVDLENGQTRSFLYDRKTTLVSHIVESLREKLKFTTGQFFALTLVKRSEDGQSQIIVYGPDDNVHQKVALGLRGENEGARCYLRVVFVPEDLNELLARDPEAFSYLYTQSCNDVIEERYAGDLKYENVLDLSALHLLQWTIDERIQKSKILRNIESVWDLTPFVPRSLLKMMSEKQVRRRISHLVKFRLHCFRNSFQVKLEYLRHIEPLPSFAARQFQLEKCNEKIFIGPKSGIQLLRDSKCFGAAKFCQLISLTIDRRMPAMIPSRTKVFVELRQHPTENHYLELSLLMDDLEDFTAWIKGYYALHSGLTLPITILEDSSEDEFTTWKTGRIIDSSDESEEELNFRPQIDGYFGPQTTRGHLCQPSCGYCVDFEGVINQLEAVIPPLNGSTGSSFTPQFTTNLTHESYETNRNSKSEKFDQVILNVNRWLTSEKNHACKQEHQSDDVNCNKPIDIEDDGVISRRVAIDSYPEVYYPVNESCDNKVNLQGNDAKSPKTCFEGADENHNSIRKFFNIDDNSWIVGNVPEPLAEVNCYELQSSRSEENLSLRFPPPPDDFCDRPFPGSENYSTTDILTILPPAVWKEDVGSDDSTIPPPLEFSFTSNIVRSSSAPPPTPQLYPLPEPKLPSLPPFPVPESPASTLHTLLPPPADFAASADITTDWLNAIESEQFPNELHLQFDDICSKRTLQMDLVDGKAFPGLDRL